MDFVPFRGLRKTFPGQTNWPAVLGFILIHKFGPVYIVRWMVCNIEGLRAYVVFSIPPDQ
ncbi:hypothetical protein [Paenibacillus sp. RC21]|uniref:hypothetical protein n=1 Tax=Paenibacillus sp. RC21 TaxID=3156312 RepID=UPI0038381F0D